METQDLLQDNPHISDPDKQDDLFEEFSAYFDNDEDGPSALVKAFIPAELQQQVTSMIWSAFQDGALSTED